MNVKIGSEMDPRGSQMALYAQRRGIPAAQSMRVNVGAAVDPRQKTKDAMLRARVPEMRASVGQPDCNVEQDPRVIASVLAAGNGNVPSYPNMADILAGTGLSPAALAYIDAIINTNKYCPSPARVGWQCDSLSFVTTSLAAGGTVTVPVVPTQAFCASALVGAAGTSADPNLRVTELLYNGNNYVTSTPWILRFYTSEAACCLCVRSLPIIEPNTTISMTFFNPTAGALIPEAELFGESLFCGGP